MNKAVLVNCEHGTSRSTAVVYAYCRAVLGMTNVKALATLRKRRYQKALTSGASASFVLQIDTLLSKTPQQSIPNGIQADDWISSSCTASMSVAVRSMEENNSLPYDASSSVTSLAHVSTQDNNSLSGDASTVTASASKAALFLESTQRKLLSEQLAAVLDDLVAIRKESDLSRAASASATIAAQAQFDALSDKLATTLAHVLADLKRQIVTLSADALTLSNAAISSATVTVALQLQRDSLCQQMAYAVACTSHMNRMLVS